MTKLCNSCEYLKYCARSGIEEVGCDRYKRDTTTNEEWLKQCTTEQLAEWLKDTLARCYRCGGCDELAERNCTVKICYYADVAEWLKQPHGGES